MKRPSKEQLKKIYTQCFPEKNFETLWESLNNGFCEAEFIFDNENDDIQSFVIYKNIGNSEAEILDIGTAPNQRRTGLAKDLIKELEQRFSTLFLEVDEENHSAVNLYKKAGYEITGIRKGYYKKNQRASNALNMKKNI